MLNVTTSLASTGSERRCCCVRLDNYVHDTGKRCENGHRDSDAWADDYFPTREYAYYGEQW
jgi:hypothetical protein